MSDKGGGEESENHCLRSDIRFESPLRHFSGTILRSVKSIDVTSKIKQKNVNFVILLYLNLQVRLQVIYQSKDNFSYSLILSTQRKIFRGVRAMTKNVNQIHLLGNQS